MFLSYFNLFCVFINNHTSELSMYITTNKTFFTVTPRSQVPDYCFMPSDKLFPRHSRNPGDCFTVPCKISTVLFILLNKYV